MAEDLSQLVERYPVLKGRIPDTLNIDFKYYWDFVEWCRFHDVVILEECVRFIKANERFEKVRVFFTTPESQQKTRNHWHDVLRPWLLFPKLPPVEPVYLVLDTKNIPEDEFDEMYHWCEYESMSAWYDSWSSNEKSKSDDILDLYRVSIRFDDPKEAIYFKLKWGEWLVSQPG